MVLGEEKKIKNNNQPAIESDDVLRLPSLGRNKKFSRTAIVFSIIILLLFFMWATTVANYNHLVDGYNSCVVQLRECKPLMSNDRTETEVHNILVAPATINLTELG